MPEYVSGGAWFAWSCLVCQIRERTGQTVGWPVGGSFRHNNNDNDNDEEG